MFFPTWVDILTFVGSCGIFMTLFLLFLRFLPVFPLAEIKAVMPQGDPHGHGDGGDHGHGDDSHLAANQGGGH
jgi:molybdopterin-containing oxidoreductase family membrane subunit